MLGHGGGGDGSLSSSVEVEFGANGDEVEVGGGGGRERCVVLNAEREHVSIVSNGGLDTKSLHGRLHRLLGCGRARELWNGG